MWLTWGVPSGISVRCWVLGGCVTIGRFLLGSEELSIIIMLVWIVSGVRVGMYYLASLWVS